MSLGHHRKSFRLLPAALARYCALSCMVVALADISAVTAQIRPVTGWVLSASDDRPLPGASIVEVETMIGTASDMDGRFSFPASGPDVTIAVSFVGFVTQYVELEGRSTVTIRLKEDVELLEEVYVTAFGIERKERALGFAASRVSGGDLVEAREVNVANSLSGRIAGVVVTNPASGPQGSSRVVVRGNTALTRGNEPSLMVDGVPMDGSNLGSAGMWGGSDLGDGMSGISPDDIDNITVLKGPAAAALYGSFAQNGVILVTTKKAPVGSGFGIEFNSNTVFEDLVVTTDWQREYGQGTRGEKPKDASEALFTGLSSWGAPLDGTPVVQFDGVSRPYSAADHAQKTFYRRGLTSTNTLALSRGFHKAAFRFSMSHLENRSIVPGSGMQRSNITLRGTSRLSDRLSVDARVTYIREDVDHRSRLSDSPGNSNYVAFLPTNVDVKALRGPCQEPNLCEGDPEFQEGRGVNAQGTEFQHQGSPWTQNPYFSAYQWLDNDEENRIVGFALIRYGLTNWLSMQLRAGMDQYVNRRKELTPYGTGFQPFGRLGEDKWSVSINNFDFLATANKELSSDFAVNTSFGGNILYLRYEKVHLDGSNMNIPYLNTISNFQTQLVRTSIYERQANSLFGMAELSYRNYLFFTATGRNDWSSTLSPDNNSYFYPSFSGSFVFSDAFNVPEWLSFGKVRASWAEVGSDTYPYQLSLTYALGNFTHQGQPIGRIEQTQIPLADLKPSSHRGWEAGFDTRFFDNRMRVDFAYYGSETSDQVLSAPVAGTSGYTSRVINAGSIENRGVELLLSGAPVRTPDTRWDLDINMSKNKNEVIELAGDQTRLVLAEARSRNAFIVADVGEPFSTIIGTAWLRDDQGRIVHDTLGFPMLAGELQVLGVGNADIALGVTNTFRYKGLTFSALLDMRFGGDIYSGTNAIACDKGLHKATLQGRTGGLVGNGVSIAGCTEKILNAGTDDEETVLTACSPNTVKVEAQDYWGRYSESAEPFVYDASYVKLRELKLSYRLPGKWFAGTPIKLATISLVGRNLWVIHKNVPNVDPESLYTSQNPQGIEWLGVPPTRSLGINFNIRL